MTQYARDTKDITTIAPVEMPKSRNQYGKIWIDKNYKGELTEKLKLKTII